jgi:two-component sensor histidine kinase
MSRKVPTLSARDYPEAKPYARELRERIDALSRAHDYVRPHVTDSPIAASVQRIRMRSGPVAR